MLLNNIGENMNNWTDEDYLMHHGIKGMKWGIRRYQNPDGTLTEAGMKRYRTNLPGIPGRATMNRTTIKMYKKYGLVEPNPSLDQAIDNAREMYRQKASRKEITRYMKAAKLTDDDVNDLFDEEARRDQRNQSVAETNKQYYKELDDIFERIGSKADKRVNELIESNKELSDLAKNWDGDGFELSEEILRRTGDKKLSDLTNEMLSEAQAAEERRLKRMDDAIDEYEKYLKKRESRG